MFRKVLIANRGEIAARIARTCRRLGVRSIAIYSEADTSALHVRQCDEAYAVGKAPVRESYLNMDAILHAARETGAEAIHPGYGLLSENAEFARRVETAGLRFIGPRAETIATLGDKVSARKLASRAGIPLLSGTSDSLSGLDEAFSAARTIGFPLLVKAAGGGGGIGMQLVENEGMLEKAIQTCSTRAQQAFGNPQVYLERFIEGPHHVEVQVIRDSHGTVRVLGERECSVQRRHQKIVEETPAEILRHVPDGESVRAGLWNAARSLFTAAGYENAGTCEFLVDNQGNFYFLEVNARLQVEHGITELCTGIDLVEHQLRIAAGERLSDFSAQVEPAGCAIEVRLCAENPAKQFIPSPGRIEELSFPSGPGIRVDSGVIEGSEVTPYYDSLIAKVMVHAESRNEAIALLREALDDVHIGPLVTNLQFLKTVIASEPFSSGKYDTSLVSTLVRSKPP